MKIKLTTIISLLLIMISVHGQSKINTPSFEELVNSFNIDNSLIIIGEAHEIKGTYSTQLDIISHLMQKGRSTILIEGGNSEAAILNEYLQTKNIELLNYTRARGKNYRKLITGIEELSNEYTVKFVGVDFERPVCLEYLFKKWFLNIENSNLDKIKNELLSISPNSKEKNIKKILVKIKESYQDYKSELTELLGDDFRIFEDIINNLVFQSDRGISSKRRDTGVANNVTALETKELKESILIFGSNHLTHKNHLGSKIGKSFKDDMEILPILFSYKNCTNYQKNSQYSSSTPLINYMKDNLEDDPKISFSIEKNEVLSPHERSNRFILVSLKNL